MIMAARLHNLERKPHADEKPPGIEDVGCQCGSAWGNILLGQPLIVFLDFAVAVWDISYLLTVCIALLITIPQ